MSKRVLIGGLHHESDTFNPIITDEKDIWVLRGQEIIDKKGKSSIDGIVKELSGVGYEIVPTIIARAVPNGVWDRRYYEELKEELLDGIRNAGKLDALCLSLHGSMRVQGIGEAEGNLLSAIRKIVGKDMPIYSTLDMHATVTKSMIRHCNGYVGYKCAPHTDTFETGQHAAKMLIEVLENNIKGTQSCIRIPMLVAGEQSETSTEPMISMINKLRDYEKDDRVLACSYLLGFPWADVRQNGITAIVVTKDNQELADQISQELAQYFWDKRREFCFYNETREPLDALEKALEAVPTQSPVVISDSGDNPTAGSSGDVTNFLKLCIEKTKNLKTPLVYQAIYDPKTVEQCYSKEIGSEIEVKLGACFDKKTSKPVVAKAILKSKVDAFAAAENTRLVLLQIENVLVVVTSKHVGCYDPDMMRVLGIKVEDCSIIVVKLGYLEPEIRAIANRHIMALTLGSSHEVIKNIKYKKVQRPIFPLDDDCPESYEKL